MGLDKEKAFKVAQQNFVEVQGSLVLSKAMDNTAPFAEALKNIENRYQT